MVLPSPLAASRARPRLPLLSSLPAGDLADLLVAAGGSPSQARSAAAKAIAYALGGRRPSRSRAEGQEWLTPRWDAEVFAELGIGAWAHPALSGLDAAASLELFERAPSEDGTERLVLRCRDGSVVETVIIPGPARTTVCISSQVGCARACTFCETGNLGLSRQLDAGEIVDQVRVASVVWGSRAPAISNVVFMGMGEPFDNLTEVSRAASVLTDERGLGLSRSRITVSTVGVADRLEAFFRTCPAELAISLNAPDDTRRSAIMPINKRFPLDALLGELKAHKPRGKIVLFEYVLIAGFNDAEADADLLAALVEGVRCRVNVIPVNPGPDPAIRTPSPDAVDRFVARLASHDVVTLVRRPRGRAVGGACGQLVSQLRIPQAGSATLPRA